MKLNMDLKQDIEIAFHGSMNIEKQGVSNYWQKNVFGKINIEP